MSSNRRWPIIFNVIWLVIVLGIFTIGLPPDIATVGTVIDFIPRWLFALPLILLVFCRFTPVIAGLSVILLVSNFLFIQDYQLGLFKPGSTTGPGPAPLRIITFNLGSSEAAASNAYDVFDHYLADIMVVQEAAVTPLERARPAYAHLECSKPLCVISRMPVRKVDGLNRRAYGGWGQVVSVYETRVDDRKLYIANIHLQTPRHAISTLLHSPLKNWQTFIGLLEEREIENQMIAQLLQQYQPLIIAGDFNLTQQSSLYQRDWGQYVNAFDAAGSGIGHTRVTRLVGARIDHVLYSNEFTAVNAEVLAVSGSDHLPVMAELILD